jgi:hypothetical protein
MALSGCNSEQKDDALGGIITECQLAAHGALESSTADGEKKHFELGAYVENCLKGGGLKPNPQNDDSCVETPQSAEDGAAFVKPLQKCWKKG